MADTLLERLYGAVLAASGSRQTASKTISAES
jgi:hypothetical protein